MTILDRDPSDEQARFFASTLSIIIKQANELAFLQTRNNNIKEKNSTASNITDFFFFLSFGLCLIICLYVTLDGVIRLYVPVIAIISFIISKITIGRFSCAIINSIFNRIYNVIFIILHFVFYYPIQVIMILSNRTCSIAEKLKKNMLQNRSKNIVKRKTNEIKRLEESKK